MEAALSMLLILPCLVHIIGRSHHGGEGRGILVRAVTSRKPTLQDTRKKTRRLTVKHIEKTNECKQNIFRFTVYFSIRESMKIPYWTRTLFVEIINTRTVYRPVRVSNNRHRLRILYTYFPHSFTNSIKNLKFNKRKLLQQWTLHTIL